MIKSKVLKQKHKRKSLANNVLSVLIMMCPQLISETFHHPVLQVEAGTTNLTFCDRDLLPVLQ